MKNYVHESGVRSGRYMPLISMNKHINFKIDDTKNDVDVKAVP